MIQISFSGRLARDPEVRQGKSSPYTTFTVAATHGAKGQDGKLGTEFIQCLAGGHTGENIAKFFHQGDQIVVYGSVHETQAYMGKKDNQPHASLSVNCFNFDFGAKKNNASAPQAQAAAPAQASSTPVFDDTNIPF